MYGEFGVPVEVEQGIVQLLFSTAFPAEQTAPFTVITRDYSLWLSQYPHLPATLVDVSLILPKDSATLWLSEKELRSRVKLQLLNGGWSPEQIVEQYRPPRGRSTSVPDFGLLTQDGKLIAIVEVKDSKKLLGDPLSQAIETARDMGARFALLTNGKQIHLFDEQIDWAVSRDTYPSPNEIGLDVEPFDIDKSAREKGPVSLVTIINEKELQSTLKELKTQTLIIDHTLPWGLRNLDEVRLFGNRLGVPKEPASIDLATHLLLRVAPTESEGTVVGLVPQGLCFSSSESVFRQMLLNNGNLRSIIELPADLLKPYASIRLTLLAFERPPSPEKKKTYIFSISTRNELLDISTRTWFSGLRDGLLGRKTNVGFYAEVGKDDSWTALAHDPDRKRAREELSKYPNVPLEEMFAVFQGFRHSREEALGKKGIPTLRGRDISRKIDSKEELIHYSYLKLPADNIRILAGDILLQRIGASPACMIATPGIEGAIPSDTVIVIRANNENAKPRHLVQFLSSNPGQQLLASITTGEYAPTLSVTSLRRLPVPILPDDLSRGLDELAQIEQRLRAKADRLQSLRLELFAPDSKTGAGDRLGEIRQMAKTISSSIDQAETLDFQIRNFYPFPLAFAYRTLSVFTASSDLYREQLRVAENILAFIASVSLALIAQGDRSRSGIELHAFWRAGISPGHWREIAHKSSKILAEYKQNALARSLCALSLAQGKVKFREHIQELIHAKNDYKHDRGPKNDEEFIRATINIQEVLQNCMQDLAFFTEYPVRLIRDVTGVRRSRVVSLNTLVCMGDHPGLPQEQMTYPEALIKNDLYIEEEPNRWTSLHPFIVPYNCPQCKNREFYFIDKWPEKNKPATIKSFEQGHTQSVAEVSQSLATW